MSGIATIRNKLMHEDTFELADTASFEEDYNEVIYTSRDHGYGFLSVAFWGTTPC